jgi:hypothetical protein
MTHDGSAAPAIFRIELIPLPSSVGAKVDLDFEVLKLSVKH